MSMNPETAKSMRSEGTTILSILPSLTIYTGGKESKFPSCDLSFNLPELGLALFDFSGKNRRIWKWIAEKITKFVQQNPRDGKVAIQCYHGRHRSVETAEYLKYTLLADTINITLIHLETQENSTSN
jgi:hypothetical protein